MFQVPDVRDPNLSSSFIYFISNIFTVILYINDVIRGGISKDDMMTGGRGGPKTGQKRMT